jgi:hypothetical protein
LSALSPCSLWMSSDLHVPVYDHLPLPVFLQVFRSVSCSWYFGS